MELELKIEATEILPGRYKAYKLNGRHILVFNGDGTYYALAGLCSHEDLPLEGGTFTENVITCPHHGSRFNIRTGKVLSEPAERNLSTYPTRVEGSQIIIRISSYESKDSPTVSDILP